MGGSSSTERTEERQETTHDENEENYVLQFEPKLTSLVNLKINNEWRKRELQNLNRIEGSVQEEEEEEEEEEEAPVRSHRDERKSQDEERRESSLEALEAADKAYDSLLKEISSKKSEFQKVDSAYRISPEEMAIVEDAQLAEVKKEVDRLESAFKHKFMF